MAIYADFFWTIPDENDNVRLINGSAIRVVDEIRPDHVRIHFDGNHVLELEGKGLRT